jgi:S1-C subfamily serine protease
MPLPPPKPSRRRQRGASAALLLIVVIVAAALWYLEPWQDRPRPGPFPDAIPRAVTARGNLSEDEQNNIAVFKAASASVVNITTTALQRDFFSRDSVQVPRGTGSGFVWDEHGHVVTNYHVIEGASSARVTLADQSTWRAALVGAFPDRDLAVLRIDAPKEKIRPILLGGSRDLQVGQKVYAIGNPFGLDQSLTTGVVSALEREIESATGRTIRGVIQTDAAINPGNSGGPLLDSAARLIGVNTAIYSPSGAFAGIGFAIPVDEVNRIVPRLIREGKFVRPTIGIQAAPPTLTQALKLPEGVAVVGVLPDSPAQKAGLQPFRSGNDGNVILGDIIVALDGTPVKSLDDLLELLERRQPGDTVTLTTVRGQERVEQKVVLGVGH